MHKKLEKLIKENPDLTDYFIEMHQNLKTSLDPLMKEQTQLDNKFSDYNKKMNALKLIEEKLIHERTLLESKLEDLRTILDSINIENGKLYMENQKLNTENKSLKQQLEAVTFTLSKMNRTVFGTSSEKTVKNNEEERLFTI